MRNGSQAETFVKAALINRTWTSTSSKDCRASCSLYFMMQRGVVCALWSICCSVERRPREHTLPSLRPFIMNMKVSTPPRAEFSRLLTIHYLSPFCPKVYMLLCRLFTMLQFPFILGLPAHSWKCLCLSRILFTELFQVSLSLPLSRLDILSPSLSDFFRCLLSLILV